MGGLKDQLLKAGLVNEKQIKKARQDQRKESRQQQGPGKGGEIESDRRRIQEAQAEKAQRDRQLNQQRKEEAEQKALAAQIRQLIEAHRQPLGEGETPFNFVDEGKVKRLYLADSVRRQIARGLLGIVKLDDHYELVPADVVDKIRRRDPSAVVLMNDRNKPGEPDDNDDPYAKFQVPDDLMW